MGDGLLFGSYFVPVKQRANVFRIFGLREMSLSSSSALSRANCRALLILPKSFAFRLNSL